VGSSLRTTHNPCRLSLLLTRLPVAAAHIRSPWTSHRHLTDQQVWAHRYTEE